MNDISCQFVVFWTKVDWNFALICGTSKRISYLIDTANDGKCSINVHGLSLTFLILPKAASIEFGDVARADLHGALSDVDVVGGAEVILRFRSVYVGFCLGTELRPKRN